MKIVGDYHTHTVFTHGTGTIEENVQQAIARGLKEIAITEHSFKHMAHGINKKKFWQIKAEIERLRVKYPNIKILLGIEANLISSNGDIDVPDDVLPHLDIIVLGYHKLFWTSIKQFFTFLIPNTFRIGKASKKRIEKNTLAYEKAIEKYPINILAHLKYANCDVDCKRLAEFCAKRNVFVELNGKGIYFTYQEVEDMLKTNVNFIVDSDAHSASAVGVNSRALKVILQHNISCDRIVNIDKTPNFERK